MDKIVELRKKVNDNLQLKNTVLLLYYYSYLKTKTKTKKKMFKYFLVSKLETPDKFSLFIHY